MSSVPATQRARAIDPVQTLREVAQDLRQLVTSLRTTRLRDRAWLQTARTRCLDLGERLGTLRGAAAGHGRVLQGKLGTVAQALQEHARALGEVKSAARLRALRDSLAGTWEDLVSHLRIEGVWTEEETPQAIRVPRVARSVTHVMLGLVSVVLYQFFLTKTQATIAVAGFVALFVGLDVARRIWPKFNVFMIDGIFRGIVRPRERYKVPSATWYVVGLFIGTLIAPREAICAGALVLAFGDPTAAAIGHRWGHRKLRRDKSVVGTLAFVVAGAVVAGAYLAFATTGLGVLRVIAWALTASVAGAAAELFGDKLDDNMTIPVAAALAGFLFI